MVLNYIVNPIFTLLISLLCKIRSRNDYLVAGLVRSESPVCVQVEVQVETLCAVTVCFLLLTVLRSKIPHEEMARKEELKRPCLKRCHPTQTTRCDLGASFFAKEMMQ